MANLISVNQIVTPTDKWQVTIPKKVREKVGLEEKKPLNITVEKGKIVMAPIKAFVEEDVWDEERRKKLLKALREVRGIWAKDWPQIKKRLERQRKFELKATRKMKNAW